MLCRHASDILLYERQACLVFYELCALVQLRLVLCVHVLEPGVLQLFEHVALLCNHLCLCLQHFRLFRHSCPQLFQFFVRDLLRLFRVPCALLCQKRFP